MTSVMARRHTPPILEPAERAFGPIAALVVLRAGCRLLWVWN